MTGSISHAVGMTAGNANVLAQRFIGQEGAVQQLRSALSAAESSGQGAMIDIVGRPGTGKSLLAELVPDALGGRPSLLVQGGSKHQPHEAVTAIYGSPQGFIGSAPYEESVAGFIKANPDGVVVFDEAEKLHSTVADGAFHQLRGGVIASRDAGAGTIDASRATIIRTVSEHSSGWLDNANRGIEELFAARGITPRPLTRVSTDPIRPESILPLTDRAINRRLSSTVPAFREQIAAGMPDAATIARAVDPDRLARDGGREISRNVDQAIDTAISAHLDELA